MGNWSHRKDRDIVRNLLDKTLDSLLGNRVGRWIAVVSLVFLAAMLIILPNSTQKEHATNQTVGFVLLGLDVLVLIAVIYMEIRDRPITQLESLYRRASRTAIRSGRALRIPPLSPREVMATQDNQRQVRDFALELMSVPWGEQVRVSSTELRPLFDQTVAAVRRVSGDWRKYAEPVGVFASMPSPWCFIGAAEIMQRLAYTRGNVYVPYGLRQGLRFIALAQAADPENADALVTRARLLASSSDRTWLRLAEDTLRRVQAIAPQHPRLPAAEATLFSHFREYEKALAAADQAIARAPTPFERVQEQIGRANILLAMKRDVEAIAAYQQLLETESDDPWLWHNLSIALARVERYQEALESNQRALALMPFAAAMELTPELRKLAAKQGDAGTWNG
jgi:tetratricopeptide (TPR) repeat protein